MADLLTKSEHFEERLHPQRKALERRREAVIKTLRVEFEHHMASEDFTAINGLIGKHETPPEELKEEVANLQKRRDSMLESAKTALRELAKTENPKLVDDEVNKWAAYPLDEDRVECQRRREELMSQARAEIEQCINSEDSESTISDAHALLEKYGEYPQDLNKTNQHL
eukprot:SAG11_NODE_17922_length_505_cov_1.135468_1_plen_168_part_11